MVLNFDMAEELMSIKGKVLDSKGKPATEAKVYCLTKTRELLEWKSKGNGLAHFAGKTNLEGALDLIVNKDVY